MRTLALTGGIATGKSTASRMILEVAPETVVFDCDASVRSLLDGNRDVVNEVVQKFGNRAIDEHGTLNRTFLREEIYRDARKRGELEGILHPRVREDCLASRAEAATEGRALFIADVPLLFEKGFDFGQERSLLIATTRATQIQRLRARNGFKDQLIEAMLDAQLSLSDKLRLADVVFWNEGPLNVLRSQIHRFFTAIS